MSELLPHTMSLKMVSRCVPKFELARLTPITKDSDKQAFQGVWVRLQVLIRLAGLGELNRQY